MRQPTPCAFLPPTWDKFVIRRRGRALWIAHRTDTLIIYQQFIYSEWWFHQPCYLFESKSEVLLISTRACSILQKSRNFVFLFCVFIFTKFMNTVNERWLLFSFVYFFLNLKWNGLFNSLYRLLFISCLLFRIRKNYDETKTIGFWISTFANAVLFSLYDAFCGSTLPVFALNDVLYCSQIIVFYMWLIRDTLFNCFIHG